MDLHAILFDTFGTVVDWRSSLIDDLTAFAGERGVEGDWPALVDAWRGQYRPDLDRVRTGALPWTILDDLHRQSLAQLVRRFGIEGFLAEDLEAIALLWHRLRPWPDAVPGLARLARRFVVAPLSNGNTSLLLNMGRNAGLPWSMIFGADLFGHYKPDAEVYLGACRLLGAPPGRVMMCAAHNYDLAAARALGLQTAFVPRPTEYGPEQRTDLAAEGPWDVVAGDFAGLAEALGC